MSYFPSASYAVSASAATSITFAPPTASFATTASYARNTLTASYALAGGTGGGGPYLPLTGLANMTGPFTMSSATDTPLEKIVFNMGVLSQARIGANYDTGVVFSVNAFYAGGGSWVKDDVTAPSFATFEHVTNGQFEWRTSPGDGNPNITWTKPFIIGNNGVAIFPTLLPVGISGSLFVGGTINGVGSGITGVVSSSYALTASYAPSQPQLSSSYALSASWAPSTAGSSNGVFGGNFSGSFSGSVSITGSLVGSASYATTSSFASTAQNVLGAITSASYSTTASYATLALNVLGSITSASYALSASWAPGGAGGAVYGGNFSGSFSGAVTGSFTGSFTGSLTGSLLGTSSLATLATFSPKYLPLTGSTMTGNITMGSNNLIMGPANDVWQGSTISAAGSRIDSPTGVSLCYGNNATLSLRASAAGVGISGSLRVSGSVNVLSPYTITGSFSRNTIIFTATASAPTYNITGSVAIGSEFIGYIVSASAQSRLRMYINSSSMLADLPRAVGIVPSSSAGVILDVVFPSSSIITIAPGVNGYNNELPVTSLIPWTITNNTAVTSSFTCSIVAKSF